MMIDRRRLLRTLVISFAGFVASVSSASATAPLVFGADEIWKRSAHGTIYAGTKENRLVSLCIEADGVGNWLPVSAIEGISFPKLEGVSFMQGVALNQSDKFVPHWGMDGLVVLLETQVADDRGNLREGPSDFFVIDKNRVAYRVRQVWEPDPGEEIVEMQEESWSAIREEDIRRAPCMPIVEPSWASVQLAGKHLRLVSPKVGDESQDMYFGDGGALAISMCSEGICTGPATIWKIDDNRLKTGYAPGEGSVLVSFSGTEVVLRQPDGKTFVYAIVPVPIVRPFIKE